MTQKLVGSFCNTMASSVDGLLKEALTNRGIRLSLCFLFVFIVGYSWGQQQCVLIIDREATPVVKELRVDRAEEDDGWRMIHTYVGQTREEDTQFKTGFATSKHLAAAHPAGFLPLMGARLQKEHTWYSQIYQDEIVWFLINSLDEPSKLFASGDKSVTYS
jgi:hypothetical protein